MATAAMSGDLLRRHIAATRATLVQLRVVADLAENQLAAMDAFAQQEATREATGRATIDLPASCTGYAAEDCGRQDEQGVIVTGRTQEQRMCRGCAAVLP